MTILMLQASESSRALSKQTSASAWADLGRPVQMYDELAEQLEKAWYEVVRTGRAMN